MGSMHYIQTIECASHDNSLTPVEPKMPDFKVSTQYYQVENGFERLGMGREDEYFWKTGKGT